MTKQEKPAGKMTLTELLKNQDLINKFADNLVTARVAPEKTECQLFLEAVGRRLVDSLADVGSISLIAKMLAELGPKVRADKLRECILAVLNDGLANRTGKERARYDLAISNVEKDAYGVPRKKAEEKPVSKPDQTELKQEVERLQKELSDSRDGFDIERELLNKQVADLESEVAMLQSMVEDREQATEAASQKVQLPIGRSGT